MKETIEVLTELLKVRGKLTEKENKAIINAICMLETVNEFVAKCNLL